MRNYMLLFVLFTGVLVQGQEYELDPSFGNNGTLVTDDDLTPGLGFFESNQYYLFGNGNRFARYNFDGQIDMGFGNYGFQVVSLAGRYVSFGRVMFRDGYIYGFGSSTSVVSSPEVSNGAVVRLNLNGTIDTTFGVNGFALFDDLGGYESFRNVCFNADGSFYTIGSKYIQTANTYQMFVCKFLSNGALDTTFNTLGYKIFPYPEKLTGNNIFPFEGQYLLAGASPGDGLNSDITLIKMDADGNIVTSFAANGELKIPIQQNGTSNVSNVGSIQLIGNKIYCSFYYGLSSSQQGSLIHVYDITAPSTLIALFPSGSYRILESGKILMTNGYSDNQGGYPYDPISYKVTRYNPDGTKDLSFYGNGTFTYDFIAGVSAEGATYLYPHEDGRLFVAGRTSVCCVTHPLAMLRLKPTSLSTEVFSADEFSIYPVPASDKIYIRNGNKHMIEQLTVSDVSGKTIQSQKSDFESVDVSKLQQGVYFLNVESQGKSNHLKFIKN
jgi:uncharacterized delta-60 repeat protein